MRQWHEFLSRLNDELGKNVLQKWMPKLVQFDAANIYLEPQDSFQVSWFEEHIRPRLKNFKNPNGRLIKIHLSTDKKSQIKNETSAVLSFSSDPIDPEVALENFVPGSNLVLLKILLDPSAFNPIYLYGPPKVGKTHLLMGAAKHLQKSGKKVFFVRAQTFTDHVVQAIRLGQMQEFRKVYRDIDALIIDDIHIFSKKSATQEEFFHTFNTLHTSGKLILISSESAPMKLSEIEPRLISRFEWGISLQIEKVDSSQILTQKAVQWNLKLSNELREWLVQHFPSDPVIALQALLLRGKNLPLNCTLAERLLKDLLEKEAQNALTPEKIIKKVAAHFGITSEDILGKSQIKTIAFPRQCAMYYCRELLKLPFQRIGKVFSRDHSTVMSSIKQVQKTIAENQIDLIEFSQ